MIEIQDLQRQYKIEINTLMDKDGSIKTLKPNNVVYLNDNIYYQCGHMRNLPKEIKNHLLYKKNIMKNPLIELKLSSLPYTNYNAFRYGPTIFTKDCLICDIYQTPIIDLATNDIIKILQ